MPMRPLVLPTDAELSLIGAARYETDLLMSAPGARRQFHTVGALVAVAAAVFGYDLLSLVVHH
jgi:hypothetical protein